MSRARSGTHAWVVADDLRQAIEDLHGDWSNQKRPRWAIDTGLPDPNTAKRDDLTVLGDDQKAESLRSPPDTATTARRFML